MTLTLKSFVWASSIAEGYLWHRHWKAIENKTNRKWMSVVPTCRLRWMTTWRRKTWCRNIIQLVCTSIRNWDIVGTSAQLHRCNFKSETIFGILSPNYTRQVTWFFWQNLKRVRLTSFRLSPQKGVFKGGFMPKLWKLSSITETS